MNAPGPADLHPLETPSPEEFIDSLLMYSQVDRRLWDRQHLIHPEHLALLTVILSGTSAKRNNT